MGHLPREDRLAGRSADRRVAVIAREPDASLRKLVYVWRMSFGVSVTTHDIAGMVVCNEKEQVWAGGSFGRSCLGSER